MRNKYGFFKKYCGRVDVLLFILHTVFVFLTQILTHYEHSLTYYFISLLFCIIVSLIISPFIINRLSVLTINNIEPAAKPDKAKRIIIIQYIVVFIAFLSVFLINYLSYYPGAFSPDSVNQLNQTVNDSYNDWHPVLHTLLAFKLPLIISGYWSGSIVLFQIICFSAVLTYAFMVVYEYTNKKYAVLAFLFVIMNPQTETIAMFPWKDVAFAICSLLMMSYALRIYMTKGIWIKTPINTISFIIISAVTTIIRHNAMLFTVPLIVAVLFFIERKRFLIVCVSIFLLIMGIKYPLYYAIGVEHPDNRQVETLGLPMTVIGAAVTYTPELMDDETLEFAYKVAPKEVWESNYQSGTYNLIKYNELTDNNVIEEYGTSKVVSLLFNCFKNSPMVSLSALIKLTNSIYTLSINCGTFITAYIYPEDYDNGIYFQGNHNFLSITEIYRSFVSEYCVYPFISLGFWHYILIASALAKFRLNKPNSRKRLFFLFPLFIYNYGTSLLLTGCEDASRFFFYTFVLLPVLFAFLYGKEQH